MNKDEALKLALEALEYHTAQTRPIHQTSKAITDIKEALAKPEQKPVAWEPVKFAPVKMFAYNCKCGRTVNFESVHDVVASQRTCVGLTDEEIEIIYAECNVWDKFEYDRMLKAKLKDKNTRGQE